MVKLPETTPGVREGNSINNLHRAQAAQEPPTQTLRACCTAVLPPQGKADHLIPSELDRAIDRPACRRDHGATLLEVVIVLSVLVVLIIGIGGALTSTENAVAEVTASRTADSEVASVLNRIVSELRYAHVGSLDPGSPDGDDWLTFTQVAGWSDAEWSDGASRSLVLDEGRLLLDDRVIATGVNDLAFTLNGRVLTVELEIEQEAKIRGEPRLVARRLSADVNLQNPW